MPSSAPSEAMPSEPATSAMPSESPSPEQSQQTAAPTAIDPCTLVTADEASALAGVTFGKGKHETFSGNGKLCIYTNSGVVFEVSVAQAPDQASVDAAKGDVVSALKQANMKNVKTEQLTGLGDGAALISGSANINGIKASAIAIYVLKGTVFVAFSNVGIGHPVAGSDAMKTQATTIVSRLP